MFRKWIVWSFCLVVGVLILGAMAPARAAAAQKVQGNEVRVIIGSSGEPQASVFQVGPMFGAGGYLGVRLEEITEENRAQYGLTKVEGALIQKVEEDSPAAEAGLLSGDVVTSYAGRPVFSAAQLARFVNETPVGRRVQIGVIRSGSPVDLETKIGRRSQLHMEPGKRIEIHRDGPYGFSFSPKFDFDVDTHFGARGRRLGVTIVEMTDQLAEAYGLAGEEGVLVTSVRADSPAARAGLKAGDVITQIDGRSIDSSGDISRALRRSDKDELEVRIYRDGKAQELTAKFEKSKNSPKGKRRVIL